MPGHRDGQVEGCVGGIQDRDEDAPLQREPGEGVDGPVLVQVGGRRAAQRYVPSLLSSRLSGRYGCSNALQRAAPHTVSRQQRLAGLLLGSRCLGQHALGLRAAECACLCLWSGGMPQAPSSHTQHIASWRSKASIAAGRHTQVRTCASTCPSHGQCRPSLATEPAPPVLARLTPSSHVLE